MLSGIDFNNTGGPLLFNHQGGIASDRKHLLLADRNNNRVLIWNTLPTGNIPPDLVLGQKNFITNNPGTGLDEFNWPVSVATDGTHVIVADTYNDRILIWNTFPSRNAKPADLVIRNDRVSGPKRNIVWPWAAWTDGKRLIVTSTGARTVLIWNAFPSQNDQPADISITLPGKLGTPRTIGSDGKHLVIGDHNAFGDKSGAFFWRTFPTKDDAMYDFFVSNFGAMGSQIKPQNVPGSVLWGPTFTPDGKLIGVADRLYIWNSFPENESDAPNLSVSRAQSGDASAIALAGTNVYLSLSNGNRIVGYQLLPTSPNQKPDFAIGAPSIETNTLETYNIMSNPVPATDGKSLFVSSDFDRKLYVWKNLPDESGAKPDIIYNLGGWDNELYNGIFAMAGQQDVYIWKSPPVNGQPPDLTFSGLIGDVKLQEVKGVALDEKYFYLSDTAQNKIYVWEGLPSAEKPPKYTLTTDQPRRLSSDGKYLVVTATLSNETGHIKTFPIDKLSNSAQPIVVRFKNVRTNLPETAIVSQGHLFVADTGFNRVLIWKNIQEAIAGNNPDVILGAETLGEVVPEIGKNKLFWPGAVAFDGSFLWVGEFKFSERLLRFSVQP